MKGSSSILFSIILVVLMGLLGCMVDKARLYNMDAKAENSLYMAVDSAFAEYGKQLYETYGIFSLWMKREEIAGKVAEYESAYLTPQEDLPYPIFQFNKMKLDDIEIQTYSLLDGNGSYFQEQVLEESKVVCAEEGVSFLLDQLGWKEKLEAMKRFMKEINDRKHELERMGNQIMTIQDTVTQFKEACKQPCETLRQLVEGLSVSTSEKWTAEHLDLLETSMGEKEELFKELSPVKCAIEDYENMEASVRSVLSNKKDEVLSDYQDDSGELEASFDDVMNSLQPEDRYGIDFVEQTIEEMESFETMDYDTLKAWITSANEEDQTKAEAWIQQWYVTCKKMAGDEFAVTYSEKPENTCSDGFLTSIRTLAEGRLLEWLCGESEISNAVCPNESNPSSKIFPQNAERVSLEERAWITLYGEYYFSCYGEEAEDNQIAYEMEYLVGGKESDRSNLEETAKRILAVREGANLLYLCLDSQKRQEAYHLALMLPGLVAQPILAIAVQMVILSVWALAESVIDVRNLLRGGNVPMFKSNQTWNVSIEHLPTFLSDLSEISSENTSGLTYEQYLSMILMMCNTAEVCGRMMDVIQWNLQKNVNDAFLIEDCVCKVEAKAWIKGKTLFSTLLSERNREFILAPQIMYQY